MIVNTAGMLPIAITIILGIMTTGIIFKIYQEYQSRKYKKWLQEGKKIINLDELNLED